MFPLPIPRLAHLSAALCTLACAWLAACSTPVTPKTGCQNNGDCGSGQECHQGTCVPAGSISCSVDADCDIKVHASLHAPLACETLSCVEGLCAYPLKPAASSCDDGDGLSCTGGTCDDKGTCKSAVTSGCAIDGHCWNANDKNPTNECQFCKAGSAWSEYAPDDLEPCTQSVGQCEIGVCGAGKCSGQPKDGGKCDDKDGCTETDLCQKGVCQGVPKDCDDKDVCTNDACATGGTCTHTANTAACDDGVACTNSDTCAAGTCVGTPNDATCTDGNGCTDDTCDTAKGCVSTANAAPCDDGNPCTLSDTCTATACGPGSPKGCDDSNTCTADSCNPATGNCVFLPVADTQTCADDGLACTSDHCGAGKCVHDLTSGNCLIDSLCVATGTLAGGGCQICEPGKATTVWSDQPVGTLCEKGAACQVGKCAASHSCEVSGTAPGFCFIDSQCIVAGAKNSANPCEVCTSVNQAGWSLADDATPCDSDDVKCTLDVCKAGTCIHTAEDSACSDKVSACTSGVCDMQKGCLAIPADVTVACDIDGSVCTLEHCGTGTGTCVSAGQNLNCDDNVDCTLDACDPAGGCTHTTQDSACEDGNVCTTDVCNAQNDCQHPPAAGPCALPGDLDCSQNACNAGTCASGVAPGFCAIANQCIASGTTQGGGCQSCDPAKAANEWTLADVDSACPGDSVGCTLDTCDAAGQCQHTATDSLCTPTPQTCLVPQCKPLDVSADPATGCVPVDACPVGHTCDQTAQACVSAAPIAIAVAGTDGANPTNPALIRHTLDATTGTTRTWVVFQTDACATASNGQWSITKPAGMRAILLDSIVGAPAGKATTALAPPTTVALPTATGWADASTVCQAYPTVASDPTSPTQAWLSWLESAPGQNPACLTSGGQGGLLRVGRLDGTAIPPTMGPGLAQWTQVAGDSADLKNSVMCTANDSFLPSFLTGGFAVLPVAGGDVKTKGVLSLRPSAASLNALGSKEMLRMGSASGNVSTDTNPITGSFGLPHPVIVDMGSGTTNRFYGVSTTTKSASGTTTHAVWAVPISDAGVDDSPVEWAKGTTPPSGSGTGDLADLTAICGLDASVDAGGNVGVVLAVKRGGKDAVLLLTRAPGAATGVVTTIKEQVSADAGCGIGISAVRVAGRASGDFVVEWLDSSGPTDVTKGGIWLTSSATNTPVNLSTLTAWDTDGAGAPLAWRGLGGLAIGKGGVVTTVVEGRSGVNRTIFLHSLKVP